MTAYILLIITFLLAVFGTFYKSTKTDEAGTIYSRRGFPALTKVGKVVVSLLTVSLGVSLYVTWNSANEAKDKEQKLNAQMKKVEGQNDALQKEIARVLNPIKDVQLSFDLAVPLDHPALATYRKHLEGEFASIIEENEQSFITPLRGSDHPEPDSDSSAYTFFDHIGIDVQFFKPSIDESSSPDLEFSVFCGLDPSPSSSKKECVEKMHLDYEGGRNLPARIRITAWDVRSDPSTWRNNGRMAAISDLAGAKILLRFDSGVAWKFSEFERLVEIELVLLKLSGRTFTFSNENLQRFVDERGIPFYIATFPRTIS